VTYNKEVGNVLERFKSANSEATGQIFDTSPSFVRALDNPTAYGAPDATCVNQNGVSCLWYDTYHPGIAIHKLLAQAFYDSVHPL
jgi:phospholipase/lecithinase/hemolysin